MILDDKQSIINKHIIPYLIHRKAERGLIFRIFGIKAGSANVVHRTENITELKLGLAFSAKNPTINTILLQCLDYCTLTVTYTILFCFFQKNMRILCQNKHQVFPDEKLKQTKKLYYIW